MVRKIWGFGAKMRRSGVLADIHKRDLIIFLHLPLLCNRYRIYNLQRTHLVSLKGIFDRKPWGSPMKLRIDYNVYLKS